MSELLKIADIHLRLVLNYNFMWNTAPKPNVKRKEKSRKRINVRLLRVNAIIEELESDRENQPGTNVRIILNDFSITGMGFFSTLFLDYGAKVRITIDKPFQVIIHGKVIWCQEFATSNHIISQNEQFHYRIGVEFSSKEPDEISNINKYFQELTKNQLTYKKI